MDDGLFIKKINEITREHGMVLPIIEAGKDPSSGDISLWALFFQACIKSGILLGDEKWSRIKIDNTGKRTRFSIEGSPEGRADADFRVGLQLLLSLFGDSENGSQLPSSTDKEE